MTLQTGDIRFALPASTAQVDNGGGPPTSNLLPDGSSNAIYPDISEDARTGGLVEVVHLHGVLRNTDTDQLLGANIIISEPPDDPGVALTLVKSPSTFARRPDLVKLIESGSQPGSEFGGYLLENHTASMRQVSIAQRPGATPPGVNTTLFLVQDEGLVSEKFAYVRVRRVTVTEEIYTTVVGNQLVDYVVQVAACEIFSPLGFDFDGSPASPLYARASGKTLTRRVNFSDAGAFYSASRLVEATAPEDTTIKVESVYTQIVPNTRTDTPLLNQRPGGQRVVTLTDSQGSFEVSAASHTGRQIITEAEQGYTQTFKMQPPPAPGTISVSYSALQNWQAVDDDGAGNFSGQGSGTVLYSTGDAAITMDALPDYNTPIIWQWADTAAFVNACPGGPITLTTQPPEFEVSFTAGANVNGATVTWPSGGTTATATADAAGVLSGDASGQLVSALGKAFIRPSAMPDPGANFTLAYSSLPTVVESFVGVSVDAGGFAAIATAQEAVPGTISVQWATARTVSKSSGADLSGSSASRSSSILPLATTHPPGFSSGPGGRVVRTKINSSVYTQTTTSASTNTLIATHSITDDAAGGFGNPALGSVNYGGQTISLRLVSQGGTTDSYQSDHENAARFYEGSVSMSGG